MEDPILNRSIEETRELHMRWSQFNDFFKMALRTDNRVTAEAEAQFLDLKTRIAMLHDGFMQALDRDQKIGQGVISMLAACILLRRIPLMSAAEIQKMELDWNEIYLLMTETIANMEEERHKLAAMNATTYKMNKFKEMMGAKIHNFLYSAWVRMAFILGVICFVIFGVPAFDIYDWSNLKQDVRFTAPVVRYFEALIRDFFNPDVRYASMDEIKRGETKVENYEGASPSVYTQQYLISQLPQYGFGPRDTPAATTMIDARKEFAVETRKTWDKPMFAYYLLFNTTDEAVRFVNLRKQGIAQLDAAAKSKIDATINVARKANLVIIAVSEAEVLRDKYIQDIWKLKNEQMHL